MRKYQFIFNLDTKEIGFYNPKFENNNKKIGNKNIKKENNAYKNTNIILICILIIILAGIGIFI